MLGLIKIYILITNTLQIARGSTSFTQIAQERTFFYFTSKNSFYIEIFFWQHSVCTVWSDMIWYDIQGVSKNVIKHLDCPGAFNIQSTEKNSFTVGKNFTVCAQFEEQLSKYE